MTTARVKNWAEFQHYKDRSPPWIKLHRGLLDDFNYSSLPLASKALAPLVWLLAAETQEGSVSIDPEFLAFRLRWNVKDIRAGLTPLIEKGFLIGDSSVLAACKQLATPETETEAETEGEKDLCGKPHEFDRFWQVFPRKTARQVAEKAWNKARLDSETDAVIAGLRAQLAAGMYQETQYTPHGATYLNGRRWEDPPERKTVPVAPPSKTLALIQKLEGMKNGLADPRSDDRLAEASVPRLGSDACNRFVRGDGDGLG